MFIDGEPVIAQCPLEPGQKDKNCYLSYERLIIATSWRKNRFNLNEIIELSFKHKLLLLPLVVGGILAPFSLIAIFNDVINLWLMLILFMSGSLLIYYGFEGRNTLSITTTLKEYDYFINTPSQNLKAFLKFVMKIRDQKGEPRYYLAIASEIDNNTGSVFNFEKEVELFENPPQREKATIFVLEPLRSGVQVIYRTRDNGEVTPFVTGKISKDDLIPFTEENHSNL